MVYKLNYTDKETAIKDFIKKGVFIEAESINKEIVLSYGKGIQAVVEIGKIVLTNGTYDTNFKEITAPVYVDGYSFDVMSDSVIKFESEIFPKNSKHGFAGCDPIKEIDLHDVITT